MKVIDRGVVFDAGAAAAHERCNAFTSLVRLADGTLLCSFKTGPRKLSPTDRLIIMKNADNAQTWQRHFDGFDTTFDGTRGSFTAGYLFERHPGRLMISLHWIDRSDPALPLSNPVTSGVLPMKYLIAESSDGGECWSPPRAVSLAPHRGTNPTGEILRLRNGPLLLSYESWKEWDAVDGGQSANVKLSEDEGRTWSGPFTMASDPTGRQYYWDNHVTLDPETGRLLAAFWTHDAAAGQDAPIHLAWGEPDGKTWSEPISTRVRGQVTSPLLLGDGRLLLVYVHRHDPPSVRAVFSHNMGKTWESAGELILHICGGSKQAGMEASRSEAEYWDDMTRWTFGHPKAIALPDGQVLVMYYAPPGDEHEQDEIVPTSIHWVLLG